MIRPIWTLVAVFFLLVDARARPQGPTEAQAFEQAKVAATAEGWEAFLTKHPKGKLVKTARQHLDETLHALALAAIRARDEPVEPKPALSPQKAAHTIGDLYKRCRTPEGADKVFLLWDHATWAAAKASDTSQGYRAYVLRFPTGKHAKDARPALEEIAWRTCQSQNTLAAYREFLSRHGRSKYASKARAMQSQLEYAAARQLDTIEGYEQFLKKNPRHKAASERLRFLLYHRAVDSGKLADWKAFKRRYGGYLYRSRRSKNSDKALQEMLTNAKTEIEHLLYAEIVANRDVKSCEEYLRDYPTGAHKSQVLVHMESALFDKVVSDNQPHGYIKYLQKYRGVYRETEIRSKLDALVFCKLSDKERFQTLTSYPRLYPKERQSMLDRMLPYMHEWAKRVATEQAYETFVQWYAPTRSARFRGSPKKGAAVPPPDPRVLEILNLLDPILWKKAQQLHWHSSYKSYLRRLPEGAHVSKARERLLYLSAHKAIPKLSAQSPLTRSGGKWSWSTKFTETGGKVGYKLTGYGWIYNAKGSKYGVKLNYQPGGGRRIGRGSVTLKPGGKASDSYWLRGNFVGGHALFTWTGEDAGGHKIRLVERVDLK